MGAWHFVQAPLRLRNLRVALDEYLRFGLEAGVFIVPQQPKRAAAAVSTGNTAAVCRAVSRSQTREDAGTRRANDARHDETEDCHRAEEAGCAHIAENQMKGDFSRSTFRAKNHYSQVRAQQGRGVLDAELNEQADITGHIARTSTTDIIGVSGAPFHPATAFRNFQVKVAPDGKDLPDRARALLRRRHPV